MMRLGLGALMEHGAGAGGAAIMMVRIGVFERPGADAALRETLETAVSPGHARILMASPSRFVVIAPASDAAEGRYVRCETLDEVLNAIGAIGLARGGAGAGDVAVHHSVEPETQRWLESAVDGIEALGQPAANDP